MAPDLNQALTAQLEALAIEADPRRRDRHLLEAAEAASGAVGVALWQQQRGSWYRLAGRGDLRTTSSAEEVEAVAGERLSWSLPPGRVVAVLEGRALAVGGLGPAVDPEDVLDRLEALLFSAALVADEDSGSDLADLLQPVLPARPTTGTHAPGPTDLADLRHLLGHLVRSQDQLTRVEDPEDLERRTSALERGAEHAADMLLRRLGAVEAPPGTTTLAEALEALGEDLVGGKSPCIEDDAARLPLDLEPGALLAMLLMLKDLAGDTKRLRLRATPGRDGATLRVGIAHPDLRSSPPRQAALAELGARSAAHGVKLTVEPQGLVLNLPLTRDDRPGTAA